MNGGEEINVFAMDAKVSRVWIQLRIRSESLQGPLHKFLTTLFPGNYNYSKKWRICRELESDFLLKTMVKENLQHLTHIFLNHFYFSLLT